MKKLQDAKSLFLEYRALADHEVTTYSDLKTAFPSHDFPVHAARIWRFAVLAEAWGAIATKLGAGKADYLKDWRQGT